MESRTKAIADVSLKALEETHGPCQSKQLVDRPEEQARIRQMAGWRGRGWSLQQIANDLNASGAPHPGRRAPGGVRQRQPASSAPGTPPDWLGADVEHPPSNKPPNVKTHQN